MQNIDNKGMASENMAVENSNEQTEPAASANPQHRATTSANERLAQKRRALENQREQAAARRKRAEADINNLRKELKRHDYKEAAQIGLELIAIVGREGLLKRMQDATLRRKIKAMFDERISTPSAISRDEPPDYSG